MYLNLTTATAAYTFTLYPPDTKFNRIAGIYIFLIIPQLLNDDIPPLKGAGGCENSINEILDVVAETLEAPNQQLKTINQYSLLYAGITNNFRGRFNQHHKIQQAIELGMTHIGILKVSSGRKRKKTEREILKHLNPPLNQTWIS